MRPVTGINHVAVLTDDLDRFVEFYTAIFEMEVVFEETNLAFRHAILRMGPSAWLHPASISGNPHGQGLPAMFERGHLDHLALTAASSGGFETARRRLAERGATDGTVEDLGPVHTFWFRDPDGMRVEVSRIVDVRLDGYHAPRPLAETTG